MDLHDRINEAFCIIVQLSLIAYHKLLDTMIVYHNLTQDSAKADTKTSM